MRQLASLDWLDAPAAIPDPDARLAARSRQANLIKPPGALGRLEEIAVHLACLQGTAHPSAERIHIAIFAADHGVAVEGVSPYPQSVTADMVRSFAEGGAAISNLARALGATLEVVDLGTVDDSGSLGDLVRRLHLGAGTRNLAVEAAMDEEQLAAALEAGRDAACRARSAGAHVLVVGEMGIGNTTAATALAAALLGCPGSTLVGLGSGLHPSRLPRKAEAIESALRLHAPYLDDPIEAVRRVSGFEIAALTGSYVAAAQLGLPVLVDGFIATAAALAAVRVQPDVRGWLLFGHRSAEAGHGPLLHALDAAPLLDLRMRLGEGTGAAIAVPLLRLACALHNGMATFSEARVSAAS